MADLALEAGDLVALLALVADVGLHRALEVLGDPLRLGDGGAERHGILERVALLALALVGKALPAADDLGGIGYLEALVVGHRALVDLAHHVLGDGERDHAVVGEQALVHRAGERYLVEHGAELLDVVHRRHLVALLLGLAPCAVAVDLGRGGHVDALPGGDEAVVVDLGEGALVRQVVGGGGRARGAVRLVAHDQVERVEAHALGVGDHLDGLVRGEHHVDAAAAVESLDLPVERFRVGGRRVRDVGERGLPGVALGAARRLVGAHNGAAHVALGLVGPLAHRLGDERDRRRQEEDERALGQQLLGQAQGGYGLAGTAGHDELSAVELLELLEARVDGLALVRTGLLELALADLLALHEGLPVYAGLRHVVGEQADRAVLGGRLVQMRPEVLARADDHAVPVGVARGGLGVERRDVAQVEDGLLVALALDGPVAPVLGVERHEIDAHVDAVVGRRVGPHPDLAEALGVDGVVLEVVAARALELGSLLLLGLGGGADPVDHLVHGAAPGFAGGLPAGMPRLVAEDPLHDARHHVLVEVLDRADPGPLEPRVVDADLRHGLELVLAGAQAHQVVEQDLQRLVLVGLAFSDLEVPERVAGDVVAVAFLRLVREAALEREPGRIDGADLVEERLRPDDQVSDVRDRLGVGLYLGDGPVGMRAGPRDGVEAGKPAQRDDGLLVGARAAQCGCVDLSDEPFCRLRFPDERRSHEGDTEGVLRRVAQGDAGAVVDGEPDEGGADVVLADDLELIWIRLADEAFQGKKAPSRLLYAVY